MATNGMRSALLLGAAAVAAGCSRPAKAAESGAPAQIEEIVVTANKRKELLQEVPIAVTAITAQTAAAIGITDVNTIQVAVPGLQFPRLFSGSSPALRGVGTSLGVGGQENVVPIYIDDVYIPSPSATTFSFNNIQQVEVLKGPQGTLFGRNAMAGVINIRTPQPSFEPKARLTVGYGNYQTYSGDFYGSYGFNDVLAADLAVTADKQADGWGKNLFNGHDVFTERNFAVRSKWLIKPDDRTAITLVGDYVSSRYQSGIAMRPVRGALFPNGQVYEGYYNVRANHDSYVRSRQGGVSAKVERDLGFADLISITAWRRSHGFSFGDTDQSVAEAQFTPSHDNVDSFSQELRLVSKTSGKLRWLAGLFYFHDLSDFRFSVSGSLVGGLTLSEQFKQSITSYAGFGQATYDLPAGFHLTGGLRYTSDKLRKVAWRTLPPVLSQVETGHERQDAWTYKVNLAKDLAPDVSAYVGYSTGYKGGIYNIAVLEAPAVKPEKLESLEAGVKSELFDRRLRLNLAAYHYKYRNMQVTSLTRDPSGFTSSSLQNAASAKNTGFEADFEAQPTRALTLRGGVAFMRSRFTEFPDATISVPLPSGGNLTVPGSAKGLATPHAPRFSGSLSADYRIETAAGDFTPTVSYSHTSAFAWDADNRLKQHAYDLVNASVAWTPEGEAWRVTAWVKNLTQAKYSIYTTANVIGDEESPAPPRTYGLTVAHDFF
jgi:iron complex outermembrane receptor protein